MKRARGAAIAGNIETAVFLDLERREFGRVGETGVTSFSPELKVNFLTATQELSSASKASIRFFPDGTSTGGGVTLAQAGKSWTLIVRWLDGQLLLSE